MLPVRILSFVITYAFAKRYGPMLGAIYAFVFNFTVQHIALLFAFMIGRLCLRGVLYKHFIKTE